MMFQLALTFSSCSPVLNTIANLMSNCSEHVRKPECWTWHHWAYSIMTQRVSGFEASPNGISDLFCRMACWQGDGSFASQYPVFCEEVSALCIAPFTNLILGLNMYAALHAIGKLETIAITTLVWPGGLNRTFCQQLLLRAIMHSGLATMPSCKWQVDVKLLCYIDWNYASCLTKSRLWVIAADQISLLNSRTAALFGARIASMLRSSISRASFYIHMR